MFYIRRISRLALDLDNSLFSSIETVHFDPETVQSLKP